MKNCRRISGTIRKTTNISLRQHLRPHYQSAKNFVITAHFESSPRPSGKTALFSFTSARQMSLYSQPWCKADPPHAVAPWCERKWKLSRRRRSRMPNLRHLNHQLPVTTRMLKKAMSNFAPNGYWEVHRWWVQNTHWYHSLISPTQRMTAYFSQSSQENGKEKAVFGNHFGCGKLCRAYVTQPTTLQPRWRWRR